MHHDKMEYLAHGAFIETLMMHTSSFHLKMIPFIGTCTQCKVEN